MGKFALIVGGSGALGEGTAIALAKSGLDIALLGRTRSSLDATAERVVAAAPGSRVFVRVVDVRNITALLSSIDECVAALGQLRVFLYGAVSHHWKPVAHMTVSEMEEDMDVNIKAAAISTRKAIELMMPFHEGTVILVTSWFMYQLGYAGTANYLMGKMAMHGFARAAFEDARHEGIKVATICPQFVKGSKISNQILDDMKAIVNIKEDQRLTGEDFAQAVMYIVNSSDTVCPTEIILQSQAQSGKDLLKFVDKREPKASRKVDTSKKVAFITGASRGIGRDTSVHLAKQGYSVAVVARSEEALQETARLCRAEGVDVATFAIDVGNFDALEGAIHQCVEQLGNLNVLINNAGVNRRRSSAMSNREVWDSVMDINLRACMHSTRTALPYMMQNNDGGCIIYVSSIVVTQPGIAGSAPYYASKHALLGFAACVLEDVRHRGIKVSVVCPGLVNNDMGTRTGPVTFDRGQYLIQNDDVTKCIAYVLNASPTAVPSRIILNPQKEVVGSLSTIREECEARARL